MGGERRRTAMESLYLEVVMFGWIIARCQIAMMDSLMQFMAQQPSPFLTIT